MSQDLEKGIVGESLKMGFGLLRGAAGKVAESGAGRAIASAGKKVAQSEAGQAVAGAGQRVASSRVGRALSPSGIERGVKRWEQGGAKIGGKIGGAIGGERGAKIGSWVGRAGAGGYGGLGRTVGSKIGGKIGGYQGARVGARLGSVVGAGTDAYQTAHTLKTIGSSVFGGSKPRQPRRLAAQEPTGEMRKIVAPVLGALVGHAIGARVGARAANAATGFSRRVLRGQPISTAKHVLPIHVAGLAGGVVGAVTGWRAGRGLERSNDPNNPTRRALRGQWAKNAAKRKGLENSPGAARANAKEMAADRSLWAKKAELIGRLEKNILLQDDNTISQWQAARHDQWQAAPMFSMKDPNSKDPKSNPFPNAQPQAYGPAEFAEPAGDLEKTSVAEREKIRQTMHEFKRGKLHSFRAGLPKRKMPKVRNRKQAIAIALSQARRMGKSDPEFVVALADRLEKRQLKREEKHLRRTEGGVFTSREHQPSLAHKVGHDIAGAVGRAVGSFAGGAAAPGLPFELGPKLGGAVGEGVAQHHFKTYAELRATRRRKRDFQSLEHRVSQLTPKQRAQRVAAARARWRRDGHPNMDEHHQNLIEHAGKSLLGRDAKVAAAQEDRNRFWHHVADTHHAYDKMKPHTETDSHLVMEVPHSGGLLHNPEQVGSHLFTRSGRPKSKIYLMHPHEVDDWISKYGHRGGQSATISKSAPYGLVEHINDLTTLVAVEPEAV